MGVEPKIGGFSPPKWMVKIMENPMNKWMILGGKNPYFWKQPNDPNDSRTLDPSHSMNQMDPA